MKSKWKRLACVLTAAVLLCFAATGCGGGGTGGGGGASSDVISTASTTEKAISGDENALVKTYGVTKTDVAANGYAVVADEIIEDSFGIKQVVRTVAVSREAAVSVMASENALESLLAEQLPPDANIIYVTFMFTYDDQGAVSEVKVAHGDNYVLYIDGELNWDESNFDADLNVAIKVLFKGVMESDEVEEAVWSFAQNAHTSIEAKIDEYKANVKVTVEDSGWCRANGSDVYWALYSDGLLEINGEGKMKDYDDSLIGVIFHTQAPWSKYSESITKVNIGAGVENVGKAAFSGCVNLKEVVIADTVTNIGAQAFAGCEGLIEIEIPDGVTRIEAQAFADCKALRNVTVADGVTKIGYEAFANCDALVEVNIPGSVESIGYRAFANCGSLADVTIAEGVKKIEYQAFANCGSLTHIKLPETMESIGYKAFANCKALVSITIPDGVKEIEDGAFLDCTSLVNVTIPGSVTAVAETAFKGCDSLKNIYCVGNFTVDIKGILRNIGIKINIEVKVN